MKNQASSIVVALLAVTSLLIPAKVLSCDRGTSFFSGTDTFVGPLAAPQIDMTNPPFIYARGGASLSKVEATDPRVSGMVQLGGNANWDTSGNMRIGPMWGTFKIAVDQGGEWEGVWTGERVYLGFKEGQPTWQGRFEYRGYGKGAGLDRHKLKMTEVVITHTPLPPPAWTGKIKGLILEPGEDQDD